MLGRRAERNGIQFRTTKFHSFGDSAIRCSTASKLRNLRHWRWLCNEMSLAVTEYWSPVGRVGGEVSAGGLFRFGVGQPVGVGAGLDDVAAEGEPVDDGGAEPGVGERFRPAREGVVGGDGHGVLFLPFRQNLEKQFCIAFVEFHVAKLINLCGYPHRSTYADTATMPRRAGTGS